MEAALERTALFETHRALGARLAPFAGWEMPIQYQGILAEARAVRSASGVFDVSHMGRFFLQGAGAMGLLEWVATNGVGELAPGRARYTLLCDPTGGILDDAIFYRLAEDRSLLVVNAANAGTIWNWLLQWAESFGPVDMEDRTRETAMIACQGPDAIGILGALAPGVELPRPFRFTEINVDGAPVLAARTGYTGEDGFEAILEAAHAPGLWARLLDHGAAPCGLGARDVLRLEAGLPLHGNDIDTETNPVEAGLERFVQWNKEFSGAEALRRVRNAGPAKRLVGLRLDGRNIPRHGYAIQDVAGKGVGVVTSGGYSPTLDTNIALGYVDAELAAPDTTLAVDIRGRVAAARVVPLPFYSRRRSTP